MRSKVWLLLHKKCAMVGQHQIKCGHELGAVFFYYCYYKLWESLLNSEYMPLLSTREKRWDSNYFFQSHHGVSSVMVKLDQNLYQKSHFFLTLEDTIIVHLKESQRWMDCIYVCLWIWTRRCCQITPFFENETFRVNFKHCGYCEEPWKS